MKALHRKLLRDLWATKTQVLSIALVIACGVGGAIASFSTHQSLLDAREHYYESARFPHLFAEAKRAPVSLLREINSIPGVAEAEARLVRDVQLDLPAVDQPITARVIGLALDRDQGMNRLTLRSGRWPTPGALGEVLVNQRFAEVRNVKAGDSMRVLLNGKREQLVVVGTVLSPEYIFATRGGALPDDEWFAVLWMDAKQLAAAFNMEGAFNSVLLRLEHAASALAAADALDALLEPYGTRGAYGRDEQISHKIISQEIDQQRVMGTVIPAVFLLVAAFILNVVLHRQVNAQRGEIAALKALGYDNKSIAAHYLAFTSVVVGAGLLIGLLVGDWFGRSMTRLYTDVFHFPDFAYANVAWVVIGSAGIALTAAYGGALSAIAGVVRLKPAEALRAPAPAQFRPLLVERLGVPKLLSASARMIFRNLERRPVRALLTIAGIAGAVAIVISGAFWQDAVDRFIDVQFHTAQPANVYVGFAEPRPLTVVSELARLPGVQQVEVNRAIGARIRAGHRSYRTAVTGIEDGAQLQRIVDAELRSTAPVQGAVLLTERLARKLDVRQGDWLSIELMEGRRTTAQLRVGRTVRELTGMNVWMRLEDLNRLAGEGALVSAAGLQVDKNEEKRLLRELKAIPSIATVIVKSTLLDTFRATTAHNLLFFTTILSIFAIIIAVGVVYNSARIQLAERAWELASLRVLGFTRGEVSLLLLGELAVELAVAIPVGFVCGYWLAWLILALTHGETYEIPLVILPSTYLFAGAAIVGAGIVSALSVRARIDRLDLVAVLKTRE
jgi:putative ABC transport system permease protein